MSKIVQTAVILVVSLTLAVVGATWATEKRGDKTAGPGGCPTTGVTSGAEPTAKMCPVTGKKARSGVACPYSDGAATRAEPTELRDEV
jgi:hypothetical protein